MLRAACLAFALSIAATGPAKAEPLFAANAQEIYDSLQSGAAIPSPDGRSTVRPRGEYADHIELVVEGSIGNAIIPLGPGVGSELLWRDDGRAFAVTTSDQGLNGAYRTIVVERRASGLKMADVTRAIYDAFGQPVRCDWPEAPNVAALAWDASDGSLIVAAQIIAHSNCDHYGSFRTYQIEPWTRRIVAAWDQSMSRSRFGPRLGALLRNAPDW